MKRLYVFHKNMMPFCTYEGECLYKQPIIKKNELHPKTRYAICTWKDRCNQQVSHPEATLTPQILWKKVP